MNPHIFREYDIRGVVGTDLDAEVADSLGRAYGTELREGGGAAGPVVVGHDNRPSSPELAEALLAGLQAAGVDVLFVGTVPTPVLYWGVTRHGAAGGIQVTGSHNPPEYNGFKMVRDGRSVYGAAIQQLRRRMERRDLAEGRGAREERDILPEYVADVAGRFSLPRRVKVVVDCGNGTGSVVAVELLERVGAEVVPLYCESDGTFPNHHPDPVVDENLRDLIDGVRAERAELGIAFDGDADRIGVVDEGGGIVRGDLLLLLFGLDLLERDGPGQRMIFDVKCSQALPEVFRAAGGEPIMWKTGHSLMKEKMKETGAPLAGELSGHICFADRYYGFDDALYAAARLIELVAGSERPLSQRIAEFPAYVSTPEIRVDVPEERKFGLVRDAVEAFAGEHEVVAVDGARVVFPDGWGLLRASNTQPVLVLRYEARTPERLGEIRHFFEGWLRDQGVTV